VPGAQARTPTLRRVLIREARPEECEALGRLTLAAYTADGHLSDDRGYADELRDADRRRELATLLVALDESSGTPLGTVTYCPAGTPFAEISAPGEAEFRMLAVSPEARGQGVGAALVQACIEQARAANCPALGLCTMETMTSAHRIYERLGFTRAPERDWEPEPGIRLVAYLLPLEPREEPVLVDDHARDLTVRDDEAFAVLRHCVEPQEPAVHVHDLGRDGEGRPDG